MSDSKHPKGLGSGQNGQLLDAVCCANWGSIERKEGCSQVGSKFCQNCRLVGYCRKECQREHWKLHKVVCKSNLMEECWAPSWMRDMRVPSWMSDVELVADQHPQEYLWGNVPAYGVLGSAASSSSTLPKVLRVCFAASGDLRNVIETVCELPDDFKGKATIYVNDANPKVVVRNYLMLELLRVHGREAIDAVIALWYSLAMTASQLKAAKGVSRQLVESWAMERCASSSKGADMESTMHFSHSSSFGSSGRGSLVAKFGEEAMDFMKVLCENKLSLVSATEQRKVVMERRPDLVDRRVGSLHPAHRVAWHHFRQTGVLLPFSADHHHHNKANRFLLSPSLGWTVGDGSDPLDGWDIKQVVATGVQHGLPVMDLYGCLFFHIGSKLQSFLDKWQLCHVSLVLTNRDASDLAAELRSSKLTFHRIDTSNIADAHHAGIKKVLKDWGPLMSRRPTPTSSNSSNSSACEPILITYFMNWALHYNKMKSLLMSFTLQEERLLEPAMTAAEIKKAFEKAKHWGSRRKGFEETVRKAMKHGDTYWYTYFHDFSHAFNEYLDMQGAFEAARKVGVSRKEKHAVVPHRLFVPVNAASNATPALFGNVNDFYSRIALQYNHTMTEKYVEWKVLERDGP